jgi:hypothetical protein
MGTLLMNAQLVELATISGRADVKCIHMSRQAALAQCIDGSGPS